MAVVINNKLTFRLARGQLNFITDPYYLVACTGSVAATVDTYGDITTKIIPISSGTGNYAHQPLVKTATSPETVSTDEAKIDYEDVEYVNLWLTSSTTISHFCVCRGNAATPLSTDFVILTADITPYTVSTTAANKNLKVNFNTSGLLLITVT